MPPRRALAGSTSTCCTRSGRIPLARELGVGIKHVGLVAVAVVALVEAGVGDALGGFHARVGVAALALDVDGRGGFHVVGLHRHRLALLACIGAGRNVLMECYKRLRP